MHICSAAVLGLLQSMSSLCGVDRPAGAKQGDGHATHERSDAGGQGAPTEEDSLELVPHRGLVAIDRPHSEARQYLAHRMTLERAPLEIGGDWFIEWDNAGWAAIADASDTYEPVLAQDILARVLCTSQADGGHIIRDESTGKVWSLSDKLLQHQEVRVTIKLGPSWIQHDLAASLLQWPRSEARWFWSASSLYAVLGLQ